MIDAVATGLRLTAALPIVAGPLATSGDRVAILSIDDPDTTVIAAARTASIPVITTIITITTRINPSIIIVVVADSTNAVVEKIIAIITADTPTIIIIPGAAKIAYFLAS